MNGVLQLVGYEGELLDEVEMSDLKEISVHNNSEEGGVKKSEGEEGRGEGKEGEGRRRGEKEGHHFSINLL